MEMRSGERRVGREPSTPILFSGGGVWIPRRELHVRKSKAVSFALAPVKRGDSGPPFHFCPARGRVLVSPPSRGAREGKPGGGERRDGRD